MKKLYYILGIIAVVVVTTILSVVYMKGEEEKSKLDNEFPDYLVDVRPVVTNPITGAVSTNSETPTPTAKVDYVDKNDETLPTPTITPELFGTPTPLPTENEFEESVFERYSKVPYLSGMQIVSEDDYREYGSVQLPKMTEDMLWHVLAQVGNRLYTGDALGLDNILSAEVCQQIEESINVDVDLNESIGNSTYLFEDSLSRSISKSYSAYIQEGCVMASFSVDALDYLEDAGEYVYIHGMYMIWEFHLDGTLTLRTMSIY